MKQFILWLIKTFNVDMSDHYKIRGIVIPIVLDKPLSQLTHQQQIMKLSKLLVGYHDDMLDEDQQDELDEWVGANDKNMRVFEVVMNRKNIAKALNMLHGDSNQKPREMASSLI
jgi:hypothetical protein